MTFANRFDLLMRISNTSNNALAKYLSMDPSYISRLRRGERNRPRHHDYVVSLCTFLAKQLMHGDNRARFAESVADSSIMQLKTTPELASYLESWILTDSAEACTQANTSEQESSSAVSIMPYYGITGRYQAMIFLLSHAMETLSNFTLLMYSDEGAETEEPQCELHKKWNELLQETIQTGNRVKIILKTSRNMDEMLNSVSYWLPFYTAETVDAYYYPRLRDGVYKRILYVIPGYAAVFSTAIGTFGENVSTFFVSDPTTVDSFSDEFYSYLSLCSPLMERTPSKLAVPLSRGTPCIVSFRQSWVRHPEMLPMPLLGTLSELLPDSPLTLLLYTCDIQELSCTLCEGLDSIEPSVRTICIKFLEFLLELMQTRKGFSTVISELAIGEHTCVAYENDCTMILRGGGAGKPMLIREAHICSATWEIMTRAMEETAHIRTEFPTDRIHALLLLLTKNLR